MKFHRITPRGSVSTGVRSLQDHARAQRLVRVPGALVRRTPGGTAAVPRRRVEADTVSVTAQPPRYA